MDSQNQPSQEPVQEYVSLRDLELTPSANHSANQSMFTSCSFANLRIASKPANTNTTDTKKKSAAEAAEPNVNAKSAPAVSSANTAGLHDLWEMPGVDLSNVTPTEEERENYQHKKDGLAQMETGPTCSVCDEPLNYESLMSGLTCEACHFI
ncbi:hypothetical protein F5Y01DRAFT_47944 [Xylaria sp. FL0043]|nr:hypothetical protein F5Y01DRAFT_47944 [Xylaria sp. FL0043]